MNPRSTLTLALFLGLFGCEGIKGSTETDTVPGDDTGTPGDDTGQNGDPSEDDDNDGYSEDDGDCDDGQPAMNPMATDIVGDGIDQNCDGADGFDSDGDSHADLNSGGDDCNDSDAYTFPGAIEIWYDGIDQGCLGDDWRGDSDQDLDGYDAEEVGGDDCNDRSATTNPTGIEVDDGEDNNCNGQTDGVRVEVTWDAYATGGETALSMRFYDYSTESSFGVIVEVYPLVGDDGYILGYTQNPDTGVWYMDVPAEEISDLQDEYSSVTYIMTLPSGGFGGPVGEATTIAWGPRAEEFCSGVCVISDPTAW